MFSGCPLAGSAAPPRVAALPPGSTPDHIWVLAARDTPNMSHANVETLRIGYEAVSRGDWDGATRFAHPEFELQREDALEAAESPPAGVSR